MRVSNPGRGVSAAAFEVELAFEGDLLDDLVQQWSSRITSAAG